MEGRLSAGRRGVGESGDWLVWGFSQSCRLGIPSTGKAEVFCFVLYLRALGADLRSLVTDGMCP